MKLKKTVAVLFVFLIVISSFGKPVKAYGSSLTLSRTSISIDVGRTFDLTATLTNSADTVSFASSNSSIASVTQSGLGACTITGTGIGTATITATCSNGDTATCTVVVTEVFPAPNAQNKEQWCWAAASKKVGVHNGSGSALPGGKTNLNYSDGVRIGYCGQISSTMYTADAGQRAIVFNIFSDDKNRSGNIYQVESAVQYASLRTLIIDWLGTGYYGSHLSAAHITKLNSELAAGRWVVATVNTASGTFFHSIVITNFNTSTNVYTYWDPWDDYYSTFTSSNILNNNINLHTLNPNLDCLLTDFVYAY